MDDLNSPFKHKNCSKYNLASTQDIYKKSRTFVNYVITIMFSHITKKSLDLILLREQMLVLKQTFQINRTVEISNIVLGNKIILGNKLVQETKDF